ncbi:MAG: prepilin-type N-terminal cleavage/methylation domain-containing protein, partial [Acidobacteria bacterium]|nr:prepilin-type N-terminal cleavage/methylation domain-containing protein [Acidobacteriota bacterium]
MKPGIVKSAAAGFTLFELVITLTVLSILILGTLPLVQNSVRRQKEMQLRATLGEIRKAIDEFKRDTIGACLQGAVRRGERPGGGPFPGGGIFQTDPRSRVVINDCTIFTTDNLDRFPPTLESLVDGVEVRERGANMTAGSGIRDGSRQATELTEEKELKKVYLRELPIDPMTGKSDWKLRSSYMTPGDETWDEINVFDVRSASDAEGLNGEKYS